MRFFFRLSKRSFHLVRAFRKTQASVVLLGMAMALFTLALMGMFIQSNLYLQLENNLESRLSLHAKTQAWRCDGLLNQGVPLSRIASTLSHEAFASEPSLEHLVFFQDDLSLLFTRGQKNGTTVPFVFLRPGALPRETTLQSTRGMEEIRIWQTLDGSGVHRNSVMLFSYRVHNEDLLLARNFRFILLTGLVLVGSALLVFFLLPLLLTWRTRDPGVRAAIQSIVSFWGNRRGLVLILTSLLSFSFLLTIGFWDSLSRSEQTTARYQLGVLGSVIRLIQAVEPDVQQWGKVDDLLQELVTIQKSSHFFYLRDTRSNRYWAASLDWKSRRTTPVSGPFPLEATRLTLVDGNTIEMFLPAANGHLLVIGVVPDKDTLRRGWIAALMDLLSLMAVAFMACIEIFRPIVEKRRRNSPGPALQSPGLQGPSRPERRSSGPRFMVFLLFTALFLPVAGFPDQVIGWLRNVPAPNPAWWLTLTVCSWLFGVALVSLSSRWLTLRMGFEGLALSSIGLCVVAFILNLVVPHLAFLIILRIASGFAHGCMAMLTCGNDVFGDRGALKPGRTKVMDVRDWNAAFASGAIVGIGSGGMLSARFGLSLPLILGALLLVVVLAYFRFKRPFRQFVPSIASIGSGFFKSLERRTFLRFCVILLLVMLPLQLATQGLFYFLFPLYMTTLGMGHADIARVLIGYGLIGLMTPVWKRMVQGYRQERMFIIASHLICGICIMALALQSDLGSMILAVLAMGVAAMLNDGISYRLVLKQPGMLAPGEDPEPWYRLAEMMSAVLVPLTGAGLALLAGVRGAILIIGILSLAGSVAFTFFADYGKRGHAWK